MGAGLETLRPASRAERDFRVSRRRTAEGVFLFREGRFIEIDALVDVTWMALRDASLLEELAGIVAERTALPPAHAFITVAAALVALERHGCVRLEP